MVNSYFTKVGSPIDIANRLFIFISGITFLHYVISTQNIRYLGAIAAIYLIGYVLRQYLPRKNSEEQIGESGMIMFSAVIFAYILQITGADTTLSGYLPDQMIIFSAGVYIILLARELIHYDGKFLGFVFMVCLMYLTEVYRVPMAEFLSENRWIIDLIFGMPLFYLIAQITGLTFYLRKFGHRRI